MKTTYVRCPLCDSDLPRLVKRVRSLYSDEWFNLVRCRSCGFLYINPRQNEAEKEALLKTLRDDRGFEEYEKREIDIYREVLLELGERKKPGRLLDVGCAAGGFLRLAREKGWEVSGVEINRSVAGFASKKYQLDIFGGTIQESDFPADYFDAVVTINTLEHIHQPVPFVEEIKKVLKKSGLLYVMTPNYNNRLVRSVQKLGCLKGVDPIDPTGHPCIYTPATLKRLMRRCGFELTILKSGVSGRMISQGPWGRGVPARITGSLLRCALAAVTDLTGGGSTIRAWAKRA